MKKLIIFDLDGTLTESKSEVSEEMVKALDELRGDYKRDVAIISGCSYKQFEEQFVSKLGVENKKSMLHLLPTCGAQLYQYAGEGQWCQIYNNDLTLREKVMIFETFCAAVSTCILELGPGITLPRVPGKYGEIGEDRGSQVTFSMLGQDAPLEEKIKWDPDKKKRERLVNTMRKELPGFEVRIGGTTSIDVTREGIDKAFGVKNLLKELNVKKSEALFIGDSLLPNGNDNVVLSTGVECIETDGPDQTLKLIKAFLKGT